MSVNYEALLGQIGEQYVPIENVKFDTILGKALINVANGISDIMKANLDDANLKDSELKQSIVAVPLSVMGNDYYVAIQGNDYGFFVNSGVNGLKTKYGSIYSFKTRFPSEPMVNNLMKWISKKGIPLDTRYSKTKNLTKEQRAKAQIDEKKKRATAIAFGIKQKGIKPTYFIDMALSDADIDMATNAIADLVSNQISVSVELSFKK